MSVGSINPAHRVTRRKSMSTTAGSNVAAMAAAAKGISGAPLVEPGHPNGARRPSKPAMQFRGPSLVHAQTVAASSSVPPAGSPFSYSASAARSEVLSDGPALASLPESDKGAKSRMRRASEGQSKRTSGSELRCEKCGKGYKHSSCLTKHLSVPRRSTYFHRSPVAPHAFPVLTVPARDPVLTVPARHTHPALT